MNDEAIFSPENMAQIPKWKGSERLPTELKRPLCEGDTVIADGICDFCGTQVTTLVALKGNRTAAGLCSCIECYGEVRVLPAELSKWIMTARISELESNLSVALTNEQATHNANKRLSTQLFTLEEQLREVDRAGQAWFQIVKTAQDKSNELGLISQIGSAAWAGQITNLIKKAQIGIIE